MLAKHYTVSSILIHSRGVCICFLYVNAYSKNLNLRESSGVFSHSAHVNPTSELDKIIHQNNARYVRMSYWELGMDWNTTDITSIFGRKNLHCNIA